MLIVVVAITCASAQTTEELKAERQMMRTEMNSKEAVKKAKKIEKIIEEIAPKSDFTDVSELVKSLVSPLPLPEELKEKVTTPLGVLLKSEDSENKMRLVNKPVETGLNSVDGLCNMIAPLLAVSLTTNDIMAKYKNEIIDNENGEIDIIKYKANAKDYSAILPLIVQASLNAAKAVEQLKSVQNDVKSLSPTQALPATKSIKWSVDALNVTITKLSETTKLLNNLIKSLKATGNL